MTVSPGLASGLASGLALHATAIVIGEDGVLIRGPSGAGKSRLAQALLAAAGQNGRFAALVGDDRVLLCVTNGRALVRPHPAIAGLIEERGTGLIDIGHEPAARLVCVVDLVRQSASEAAESRLPEPNHTADISGASLPALVLCVGPPPDEGARRILAFLHRVKSSLNP